ncbi:putative F-box protein At3g23970 isoform X1 [Quercus robur]|uniref:putative F-box protein At3g23970 isoform X1 n=1 Tax=Quercus robur TaxID=38942 RepID=UPI002162855B|nr:putative F-box protein At3g23970 isoform X1 [Quercus robur]
MMEMRKHHRRSSSSSSVISYYENSDVHKRRKRTATAIDDLPIDLVLEILHRLDLKSATRCKSVSKEWCSVITDPFFARCFVNYNNSRPIVDHCPFTLLLQCTNRRTKNGHLLLPLEEESYFKSLPYIPPMYQEQRHNEFNIQASCHDLFLCSESAVVSDHSTPFFYYVINPITRQWTALPPLPHQYTASVVRRRPLIGFICNSGDILQLSFRVVLIPEFEGMSTEFKVYIFSSDTSKWSESLVSCPALEGFDLTSFAFPAVPYNGLLFWCSRDGSLFGFDPYNSGCYRFIQKPLELDTSFANGRLGVSRGALRMARISGFDPYDYFSDPVLCVWEFKDKGEEGGKWCLEHQLYIKKYSALMVLAFHPNDQDIMYLVINFKVVSCNLRRKTLEVVRDLPDPYFSDGKNVFNFVLPCWPTPIHSSPFL